MEARKPLHSWWSPNKCIIPVKDVTTEKTCIFPATGFSTLELLPVLLAMCILRDFPDVDPYVPKDAVFVLADVIEAVNAKSSGPARPTGLVPSPVSPRNVPTRSSTGDGAVKGKHLFTEVDISNSCTDANGFRILTTDNLLEQSKKKHDRSLINLHSHLLLQEASYNYKSCW
jgi:hypothetical protein